MNACQDAHCLLVLGGAQSGKSGFAQRQVEIAAEATGRAPVFIATAHAFDSEMEARIAAHVAARDARWHSVDAPYGLAMALRREAVPGQIVLVDCLTLWLSNLMLRGDDVEAATVEIAALVRSLTGSVEGLTGSVVFVSNEVGGGIVPDNALARRFRDAQGRLNQAMAAVCGTVVLVAAGLPIVLKPTLEPLIVL